MCIYIYIYIHTYYMYICGYLCVYIYIYIYTHMHRYINIINMYSSAVMPWTSLTFLKSCRSTT